jgi:hypothetical protein
MRVLFLIPALMLGTVSAVFNVMFSITLGASTHHQGVTVFGLGPESLAWVAFGIAAGLYSALGLEICRTNFMRGSPGKGLAALAFLVAAIAWDARCAYGFAHMGQDRAAKEIAEQDRKFKSAEARVADARRALTDYADAPEPIAADAAAEVLARQTNDARCALRNLPNDIRHICNSLASARIAAARAHAKVRLQKALADAEAELDKTPTPGAHDSLVDLIGPELAKWLPAIVLQLGTLLCGFGAWIPPRETKPPPPPPQPPQPTPPAPPSPKTPTPPAPAQTPRAPRPPRAPSTTPPADLDALASFIAGLLADPAQCPLGTGVTTDGWLAGPQRPLAGKAGMPVSKFNRLLRAAAAAGRLTVDTTGGVTKIRLPEK